MQGNRIIHWLRKGWHPCAPRLHTSVPPILASVPGSNVREDPEQRVLCGVGLREASYCQVTPGSIAKLVAEAGIGGRAERLWNTCTRRLILYYSFLRLHGINLQILVIIIRLDIYGFKNDIKAVDQFIEIKISFGHLIFSSLCCHRNKAWLTVFEFQFLWVITDFTINST